MGLFGNILLAAIHLLLIFIDILFFLTFLRLVSYRWRPRWLIAINSSGKPAVDWLTGYIEKGLKHFSKNTFPERTVLLIGMLTLMFMRFFLVTIFNK